MSGDTPSADHYEIKTLQALDNTLGPLTAYLRERKKKHIKRKKHVNKIFTGLSRDFGGDFVYVFFLPRKEWPEKNT